MNLSWLVTTNFCFKKNKKTYNFLFLKTENKIFLKKHLIVVFSCCLLVIFKTYLKS